MLQFRDQQLAVFLFLDQAFRILPLLRDEGPVVLDAPDGEAAHRPEDREQREPRSIDGGAAEIDRHAEQPSRDRRRHADPHAADSGGQEHGREVRREKYVGTDLGDRPSQDR